MRSIYIGQLVRPAAALLIVCMHVHLGGVAMVCDYPHPAMAKVVKFYNQNNIMDIIKQKPFQVFHANISRFIHSKNK